MSREAVCLRCGDILHSDDEQEEGLCDACFGVLQDDVCEERRHPDEFEIDEKYNA